MPKYSNYNIIYRLQKWMDSVAGQTFMNYAYSWGASIVILGTLFKLTHLPGANVMLFIGMGTEVFVFFISAFDRPFDKTQDGMELETSRSRGESNAPVVIGSQSAQATPSAQDSASGAQGSVPGTQGGTAGVQGGFVGVQGGSVGVQGGGVGGTIVIGGGVAASVAGSQHPESAVPSEMTGSAETTAASGTSEKSPIVIGGINGPMTPAPAVTQETAEEMEEATKTYVERLNELNETLIKVAALSRKLTTDSEEMENLNRTLTGIAKVYEMQLKSASQQIGTQDEINEKIRKMADQMEQLNQIYARMIEAMTANVPAASAGRV